MKLTKEQLAAVEAILDRGERVELVPVKGTVRVYEVKRRESKNAQA